LLLTKDMPLLIVRHSDDSDSDPTFKFDPRLTQNGKDLAHKKGNKLLKKYGTPSLIYCSPFRRTQETLKYMMKSIPAAQAASIKIVYDTDLSRYFTREQKKNPEVAVSTQKANIPIYETRDDFGDRVKEVEAKLAKHINSSEVVWCITHTTVYKRLAKSYDVTLPGFIPFMHAFRVKSADKPVSKLIADGVCPNCGKRH
jgi:broad specificity phosphatase PhoE